MVKITNSLLAVAGLCASLVRVEADVVIHRPVPNAISGVTQIVSASVVGASAIGVQANGATLYVATEVESFVAVAAGGHTSTLLSRPTTIVLTLAEGASVYSASAAQVTTVAGMAVSGGTEVKCTGTGNGGEVDCVQAIAVSAEGIATTLVTSFVATTSPIFTITGTQAVPTTTTNAASHIMVSLTSTSILGLMGFAYVMFYSI
ncbi:hypothetical protein HYPSUDRAFT_202134 [Hypholoma sublateritium FD-334 SS-4]|uniref:Uncharacterized protein n=1 Tax=Hypholoma sublateritium (strain FD-334 SS-4) TaxID=945553 RepID=A0A0D2L6I1_HYPSF|nr:hypothetical protein HYPSUDRAFT_202134 [Hypholoma sublateritium FD-334 SS-4]